MATTRETSGASARTEPANNARPVSPVQRPAGRGWLDRLPPLALASLYALLSIALAALPHLLNPGDYVGADNDDVMRLIEVRDLLAGQSWFDMVQPRLGLDGGTLMHWSRFIDLPIALLIRGFSLFLAPLQAEAAALAVWPLCLILPVFWGLALGGRNLGTRDTVSIACLLGLFFIVGTARFDPGAIDHHNVQIALVSLLTAMLLDPRRRAASHAIAGLCVALAMAVGAETAPLMAAACGCVALAWVWRGMARAAASFGLTLAAALGAAFFLTIPPSHYGMVTCDNLSIGFVSLGAAGGAMLAGAALTLSGRSRVVRAGALGAAAFVVLILARAIAPQCLADPLANLDPLLRRLWLDYVSEAQSLPALWYNAPELVPGAYAVGVIGVVACLVALVQRRRVEAHLTLLALLLIQLTVAAIQVRGGIFACFIALFPLSDALTHLRQTAQGKPHAPAFRASALRTVAFLGLFAASVPFVWSLIAISLTRNPGAITTSMRGADKAIRKSCIAPAALAPLQTEPVGRVSASVDLGTAILRYTDQRVLSAPYHRNQAGMLAQLRISMARPEDALALIRQAEVTLVLLCPGEGSDELLAREAPDGLSAALLAGRVPDYLTPVETVTESPIRLYRVRPIS
ncbi:hypothetical protein BTR14_03835 [Rhizobium rhizosphaerae]|uniref:4-amino-4-deoxy-L-arabinose transferase n=1 Tax=Xaviernesmea rhizosphaerae TaxID=1672749 RepID=A0ABX3PGZ2_9HYPH|nr:hypothetical protein [Xaviernesmea rhizosphaerae]OQP87703.1 hypothetical protein BTR14_03835 [Xaviernesmea rhizosphaerae]